jgi:type II secretory pathway component GspD/PulD (secretin)
VRFQIPRSKIPAHPWLGPGRSFLCWGRILIFAGLTSVLGAQPSPTLGPEAAPSPTPTENPEPAVSPTPSTAETPIPEPGIAPQPPPPPDPLPTSAPTPTPTPPPPDEPIVTIGRPVSSAATNYGPEGSRKAAQLRTMPPEPYVFDRALLRDVLRYLAEACGMPYVGIPENSPIGLQLVTFRMTTSPFAALESIARQYRIALTHDNGVWFMDLPSTIGEKQRRVQRIQDSQEKNKLVAVMYQLRFDAPDRVDFREELMSQGVGIATPGGAITAPGAANLSLQTSQKVFAHRIPRLVNDVRAIVGLPPLLADEKTGEVKEVGQGETVAGAIVDYDRMSAAARAELEGKEVQQLVMGPGGMVQNQGSPATFMEGTRHGIGLSQPDTLTPLYVPPEKPQVIYNADQNSLWVVATRQQHEWVAQYLSNADKQQELIAIEVKFLETKKNPQTDIGINWQNTFGTGLTVGGSASVGGEDIGSINFARGGQSGRNTGDLTLAVDENGQPIFSNRQLTAEDLPPGTSVNNSFAQSSVSGSIPYSAVLSLDQFSFTLQAFMQDRDTSVVQYPRVLTLNNREVAITSSESTPINTGTSDVGGNAGGITQTVGQLGYLPTGTQINILPKVVNSKQIAMTVAITVSTIVGEVPINLGTGVNLYPITSGRVFNASLQVDSGYTLAVGGLEKVSDNNTQGGIPVLKDIPGVGYLFKNKNKRRDRVNLIIFITPYLIGDPARTPGISETPQSIVPLRPGVPPPPPTFTPDGKLSGGEAAVQEAFAWLDFQLRYFRQINIEAMVNLESIRKLKDVIGVARALTAYLQTLAGEPPYDLDTLRGGNALRAEELLTDLNRTLATAQENLM